MSNEFKARNGVITPVATITIATGTAPLVISSTTIVSNLNVDLLDGQHGTYYLDTANHSTSRWAQSFLLMGA
jgi:hypothetical protein